MTLFFLKQRTYMSPMMQKQDSGTPEALHSESKGPWDLPGAGENGKPAGGRASKPSSAGSDEQPKPANPWEPQANPAAVHAGLHSKRFFDARVAAKAAGLVACLRAQMERAGGRSLSAACLRSG